MRKRGEEDPCAAEREKKGGMAGPHRLDVRKSFAGRPGKRESS